MLSVHKMAFCLNLLVWACAACDAPAIQKPVNQTQVAEEGGVLNEAEAQTKAPIQKQDLYVKAISGLRLRKNPDPTSMLLTTIPFGAAIQPMDSISERQFLVDNQMGKMIQVSYSGLQGFIFERFVTAGSGPQARPLEDGKYCFKSLGTPGYDYRAFTVAGNRIIQGSGDGHTAHEEESWLNTFEGVFEENGKILIRMVVENSDGRQKPRLETWEVFSKDTILIKGPGNRISNFKKTDCIQ
jgi:hypothetical protein